MNCCAKCFSDSFLKSQVEVNSSLVGDCDFCMSRNVQTVDAVSLRVDFFPLRDLYIQDDNGEDIGKLMQSDWDIFSDTLRGREGDLLSAIFEESELSNANYKLTVQLNEESVNEWKLFCKELISENRFFTKKGPTKERLIYLLNLLILQEVPEILYRSRIVVDDEKYPCETMGMPPSEKTPSGRANPIGIPYLYLASDIHTAISEVRSSAGDDVRIAKFKVIEPLKLVDLRNARKTISPFKVANESEDLGFEDIYHDISYLLLLGAELSKPIAPRDADLMYFPSQYLCEFIKITGFDGVVYGSSKKNGHNYAIFQSDKVNCESVTNHLVDSIKAQHHELL